MFSTAPSEPDPQMLGRSLGISTLLKSGSAVRLCLVMCGAPEQTTDKAVSGLAWFFLPALRLRQELCFNLVLKENMRQSWKQLAPYRYNAINNYNYHYIIHTIYILYHIIVYNYYIIIINVINNVINSLTNKCLLF